MSLTRRTLFKLAGAGTLATALPALRAATPPKTPAAAPHNSGVFRFALGDWECTALAGGVWDIPQPHPLFAPQATPEEFQQSLEDACVAPGLFRLHFNALVIRTGKETMLVDAGHGPSGAAPFNLIDNLSTVGLRTEDFTGVFLTHAHSDHMGGLLNAEGKLVFSRAEHFCMAEEKAFWTAMEPDFSKSALDEKSRSGMISGARNTFEKIPFTTLTADSKVFDGVHPLLAPGHTPGHMTLRFESQGQMLYHMADIAHHHAVMLPHPDWTVAFDTDAKQAAATRRQILARLQGERIAVFGYHMPFPGLGRIARNGEGYRWSPAEWGP